uniref:Uncharacterized protein n=1 Tax=Marseillevirus LCMAC101 TaxID=2506602 RepID=A0A481YRH7_9VIRU|nr:MAG: hypothetical protein LCMAC101_03930 [Marseillevirus LCMAC101]
MDKSNSKSDTQTCNKEDLTAEDSIAVLERIPIADVVKFMQKRFHSDFAFKIAKDLKLKEIEEDMVGAFQITFNYLHLIDVKESFTANLMVINGTTSANINEQKIIGQGRLSNYLALKEIVLSQGELVIKRISGETRVALIDRNLIMTNIGKYQVTISVHKMRVNRDFCTHRI